MEEEDTFKRLARTPFDLICHEFIDLIMQTYIDDHDTAIKEFAASHNWDLEELRRELYKYLT